MYLVRYEGPSKLVELLMIENKTSLPTELLSPSGIQEWDMLVCDR